jgi:hypothetical protein
MMTKAEAEALPRKSAAAILEAIGRAVEPAGVLAAALAVEWWRGYHAGGSADRLEELGPGLSAPAAEPRGTPTEKMSRGRASRE